MSAYDVSQSPQKEQGRFLSCSRLCYTFVLLLTLAIGIAIGIALGVTVIKVDQDRIPVKVTLEAQTDESVNNSSVDRIEQTTTSASTLTDTVRCPSCLNGTMSTCRFCRSRNPFKDNAFANRFCFAQLTVSEMSKVYTILRRTGFIDATDTLKANRVYQVYLYPPAKQDVLSFLDNGGAFPGRYAQAVVYRGGRTPPDVMEYKVGPLHEADDNVKVEQLLQDGKINFNRRPRDPAEKRYLLDTVRPHVSALKRLMRESFDGKYYGNDVKLGFSMVPSFDSDDRVSVMDMTFERAPAGSTMHLLPVQCNVHHAGADPSTWFASDFFYLDQGPFASGEDLYNAYANGTLRKYALPKGYFEQNRNVYALTRNESLPMREHADIPPPRTYEPEGPRYSIQGQKIEWMGWSFEFSTDPFRGPGVFDVRFKGQRIAYQISLQDITLLYSTGSTGAGISPVVLSDALYLLGAFYGPPRLGLDCPDRASILNTTLFKSVGGVPKQVACVFEADGQKALWRHYSKGKTYGLIHSYLVLRSPMNLGNYDYSAEWRFHLDGHVDTAIAASGYLYTSVWDPGNPIFSDKSTTPLGYRIGDRIIGSIHDHSFLFKVDVDVLGGNNSFEAIRWKADDVVTALNSQEGINLSRKPPIFPLNLTRYLEHEIVEKEFATNLDSLNPEIWTFVNENERNAWGVKRGYRIVPMASAAETMPHDHPLFIPWKHIKYHCAITKQRDSELYGTTSIYDIFQPSKPRGGLQAMMNDEGIRNEDLVAWVTAKFMHAPTSEDAPMTMGVERGFSLTPFNYFDRSATFDLPAHYTEKDPYQLTPCYEREKSQPKKESY